MNRMHIWLGMMLVFLLVACRGISSMELSPTTSAIPATLTAEPPQKTPILTQVPLPSQTPVPAPATDASSLVILPDNAGELVALTKLGKGVILSSPVYSPNRKWMAVPTSAGIYIYDAITLEALVRLPLGTPFIAFSPDSQTLAASERGFISLWDPMIGDRIGQLQSSPDTYHWELSFSPDGSFLAAVTWQSEILVWSIATGEQLYMFPGDKLHFSQDGELALVVVYGEDKVYLYETHNGTEVNKWNTWHAGFTPNGQLWLEDHQSVRLVYLDRNLVTVPFNGIQPTFSSDGNLVALFADKLITIYDHQRGRRTQTMGGSYVQVDRLLFSPDGRTLAGSVFTLHCSTCPEYDGLDHYLVLWRVEDGTIIQQVPFSSNWLTFSPDGSFLVAAELENLRFIETYDGSIVRQIDGFYAPVIGMALAPNGKMLAALYATNPYTLRFWDLQTSKLIRVLQGRYDAAAETNIPVAYDPDGKYLAVGGDLWDLTIGEQLTKMEQAITAVTSCWSTGVDFSPDGRSLATGCFEGQLDLWRLPEGEIIKRLGDTNSWVYDLAYSPDGTYLAAVFGIPDELVQIWHLPEGRPAAALTGENFIRLVYSADGTMLATIAANQEFYQYGHPAGYVQLWGALDGEAIIQFDVDDAVSLAFSKDNQILATGSLDGTLRLWDISGRLLLETAGLYNSIQRLVFTPEGTFLIGGSLDGTVMLWGICKP